MGPPGAGPMGLYAAFLADRRNLDVTVLERDRIGASLPGPGGGGDQSRDHRDGSLRRGGDGGQPGEAEPC